MRQPNRQLLAKIWRPLFISLNRIIERACLRRDAYLDHVFTHEAKLLPEEIPRSNSREARSYLQSKLEELERVPVNFSLSPTAIEAINLACDQRNVIRDCFINRVLFLLVADITICEAVTGIELREYLPDILGDNDRDFIYAPLWEGSLRAVSEIVSSDPFRALRNSIDYCRERGDEFVDPLHACRITPEKFGKKPADVIALNCYLPDEMIPGSPAQKRALNSLAELLGEPTNAIPGRPKPEDERKAE